MRQAEVLHRNLTLWRQGLCDNRELRLLQIAAWARETAGELKIKQISELKELQLPPFSPDPALQATDGKAFLAAAATDERLALCRALLPYLPAPREKESPRKRGVIACLGGLVGERAAERFQSVTGIFEVLSLPSFSAVCEAVKAGRAAFGLLPIEDSAEGRLFHSLGQIEHYELQITHTCDIAYPDESREVRLALLADAPLVPYLPHEHLLECIFSEEHELAIAELLLAASAAGLTLRRMDSIPDPYREDGFSHRVVLRGDGEADRLLETYLALCYPRTEIAARYTHLS